MVLHVHSSARLVWRKKAALTPGLIDTSIAMPFSAGVIVGVLVARGITMGWLIGAAEVSAETASMVATAMGITLIAMAVSMTWMLHPRDRGETRIMQMPGAWIVFPLLIIFCLLGGGGLIYARLGG